MTRRGTTLTELLVVTLLLVVAGASLFGVFTVSFGIHDKVIGQNNAFAEARKAVDLMADHLRNAQLNSDSNTGSAIHAASINDLTYYADTAPTQIRYRLNGTNIERTDSGTTTTVARSIQSLTLTYYKLSSYNGSWTTTTNASAPTNSELKEIAGIEIAVDVAMDGYATQYRTLVRLRNSPWKHKLSGI
jgi:hypothetical protein